MESVLETHRPPNRKVNAMVTGTVRKKSMRQRRRMATGNNAKNGCLEQQQADSMTLGDLGKNRDHRPEEDVPRIVRTVTMSKTESCSMRLVVGHDQTTRA